MTDIQNKKYTGRQGEEAILSPVKVPTAWPYKPMCFQTAAIRPD